MIVTILFLAVMAAIVASWLSQQRLTAKPWLEEGVIGDLHGAGPSPMPAAKVGLGVFLAVVACLFALFISAYLMRMRLGDWRPLPKPNLLWLNTGMLVLSSIALHRAQAAARQWRMDEVRSSLMAAGASTLAFVAGQLLAWQQLVAAGYFLASNPANAFFYLFTAAHGLHLLGGVVALGRTAARLRRRPFEPDELRLSIDLCALYWHFLLVLWLVLFALLLLT